MSKKNNIIEINGRRYDAHTGAALDHAGHAEPKPKLAPAARPIAVHHDHPKPAASHHVRSTPRQPAKKLSRRAPQRSTTLMRRAVKKPPASLKRHVKAQGHTGTFVDQPNTTVVPKLSFSNPDPQRVQHASHIKKSRLIKHFNFSPGQPAYTVTVAVAQPSPAPAQPHGPSHLLKRQPAPNADDIFERAIQQATSHLEPAPKTHKKRRLHLRRRHAKHAGV